MKSINAIKIYKREGFNRFIIHSKSPMFKNEQLIIKTDFEKISISAPTLDYGGKTYKTRLSAGCININTASVSSEYLQPGILLPDEYESNEDNLIYYINQ